MRQIAGRFLQTECMWIADKIWIEIYIRLIALSAIHGLYCDCLKFARVQQVEIQREDLTTVASQCFYFRGL